MSIIPANKNSYYIGLYNEKYDIVVNESCVSKEEVLKLCNEYNPYIVSPGISVIGKYKINKQELDISKIVDYYKDKEKVNYFKLVPNYLKLPQALEGKKND